MNASIYQIPPGVSLIPVLLFAPYTFSNSSRELPPYPVSDEDCHVYWRDCLADSGIVGLQPITLRDWHVPVAQLTDNHVLELLVRAYMAASASDDDISETVLDPDDIIALDGGYALYVNGEARITPQCCSDLADIYNWETAAEYRGADNEMVWIGHPWVNVRFNGANLVFTGDDGLILKPSPECIVSPNDLTRGIDQAICEIEALSKRLAPIVKKFALEGRAMETARILAGLQKNVLPTIDRFG